MCGTVSEDRFREMIFEAIPGGMESVKDYAIVSHTHFQSHNPEVAARGMSW